ncbi:MAG: hypothetical protein M0Z41_01530 [Peptococcaceae bacterium]|jgi:hypothetical protein|nr:hypothetical protein [Peptococcaceae bacterium]
MRKLMIVAVLLTLVLTMAAPAWADGPGIKVITAWGAANTTGLEVAGLLGQSRGSILVTGWIPEADTGKLDRCGGALSLALQPCFGEFSLALKR